MPAADRLIEELRADGREESTGAFTLDRDKAREKLRQFQLADPRRYVLLLVEAAVLKGATRIDFAIDADDMELRFDGRPFTTTDFEQIYASMFTPADTDDLRARRQLALGLNAVMALHPRWVRVESGDGEAGTTLELRSKRPDRIAASSGTPAGTVIHVKDRFRPGLTVRFFRNLGDSLAEERLLREACRYARCDVRLEGQALGGGKDRDLAGAGGLHADVSGPDLRGHVVLRPGVVRAATVRLVSNGVLVAEHDEIELPPGFVCVVDSPRLQKDVSLQDIVRDEAHREALDAVDAACDRVLGLLCDRWDDEWDGGVRAWARDLLLAAVQRRVGAFRAQAQQGAALDGLPGKLVGVPLFEAAHGELIPLSRVIEESLRYGECEFTPQPCATRFEDGRAVLLLGDGDLDSFLRRVLGVKLNDATRWLRHLERVAEARARFHRRVVSSELPDAGLRFRRRFRLDARPAGTGTAKAVEGEVGVDGEDRARATLRLVASGCLLGERTGDDSLGGVAIVVAGALTPNRDFDNAENDEALADALFAAGDQLDGLFRSYADALRGFNSPWSAPHPGHLTSWLVAALGEGLGLRLLRVFGFAEDAARSFCEARGGGAERFFPELGVGVLGGVASIAAGARRAPRALHPAAQVPIFPTLAGPPMSLAEIDGLIAHSGSVRWCTGPVTQGVSVAGTVLLLDGALRAVLARVFGEDKLVDASGEISERAAAAVHELRTPEAVEVPGDLLGRVPVEGEGFAGVLAARLDAAAPLPEGARTWPSRARVRILRERRPLANKSYVVPFGPLRAVVNADAIRPDRSWSDIDDPEASARIGEAARRASPGLLPEIRERIGSASAGERRAGIAFLLEAAAAPFPRASFRAAWAALFASDEPAAALAAYRVLLVQAACHDISDVVAALELLKGMAGGLTVGAADFPAALDDLLQGSPVPPQTPRAEIVVGLFDEWFAGAAQGAAGVLTLPVPGALADAPLLETIEHRPVTLSEAAALVTKTGRLPFVPDSAPDPWPDPPADGSTVLRLDERTREVLPRILPPGPLVDVRVELRRARRVQALETLPALSRIGLDEGTALVVEPIATNAVVGEVGLVAQHEGAGTSLLLTVCTKKRRLATVTVEAPVALRAVVDVDDLGVDPDALGGVGQADIDRLAVLCAGYVPRLLRKLAERWPELPPESRRAAWAHVLDHLRVTMAPDASAVPDEAAAMLARLDGFRLADGGKASLGEAFELARRAGRLIMVPVADEREVPDDLRAMVVAVRPFEARALRVLFPTAGAALTLTPVEWEVVRRRAAARPLPEPDSDPLAKVEYEKHGVRAVLFLSRRRETRPEVSFGRDGLEVARGQASPLFPCSGVVTGELALRPGFDGLELTEGQQTWLDVQARHLYNALVELYRAKGRETWSDAEAAESHLREALVRLHRAHESPTPPNGCRTLYGKLARFALFRPTDGRRLKLSEVLHERPAELEPLGLWPGARAAPAGSGEPAKGSEAVEGAASSALVLAGGDASPPAGDGGARVDVAGASVVAAAAASASASASEASAGGGEPGATFAPSGARVVVGGAGATCGPPVEFSIELRFLDALRGELRRYLPLLGSALSGGGPDDAARGKAPAAGKAPPTTPETWERVDLAIVRGSIATVASVRGSSVAVHLENPAVQLALRLFEKDPTILSFLVSAIYTVFNVHSAAITDSDEAEFQQALVRTPAGAGAG